MKHRNHLMAAACALAFAGHGAAWAQQACSAAPLGEQRIYLRGGMNSWAPADDYAFTWSCDAYYLNVDEDGLQEFKIADAGWSPGATYGAQHATPLPAQRPAPLAHGTDATGPGNIKFRFAGEQTVRLAFDAGRAVLSIGPKTFGPAGPAPIADPVALSLSFDSRAASDKAPFGSVTAGSAIAFTVSALPGVTSLTMVVEKRKLEGNQTVLEYLDPVRVPMQRKAGTDGKETWSAQHRFAEPNVYGYYFEAVIGGQTYVYQNNRDRVYWTRERGSNGKGAVALAGKPAAVRRFRQTVYAADFTVPSWARDAVYYYIFPERFRNGDKRNDHVAGKDRYQDKPVEVHSNWLDLPNRPGSGDGSDKVASNDFYGGDLQGVIEKLDYIRALGANTIYMTPVFTASSNHKYDTADYRSIDPHFGTNADYARLAREAGKRGIRLITDASFNHTGSDSVYFDRYGKYPAVGAFEKEAVSPASPYASWYTFDAAQSEPEKRYKGWEGAMDLPELDKNSPDFRRFAYGPGGVTQLWLDQGSSGWRMDVAPWVPDSFWREWRTAVKAHRKDALTIAETWFDSSKYFLGDTFDSTMNYIFRNAVLDYAAGGKASAAYRNIELMREAYPKQSFYALMNLLSTHDQARSLHVLGDESPDGDAALARKRYRMAVFFQMMFPGAPAVYYGDEVGLSGGDDPANRAGYPWADQGGKPDLALLADFKKLIAMRKQHPVLRHGSIDAPLLVDDNVVVLARQDGKVWALCATNNAAEAKTVTVTLPTGAAARYVNAWDGTPLVAKDGRVTLTVPALFGVVAVSR